MAFDFSPYTQNISTDIKAIRRLCKNCNIIVGITTATKDVNDHYIMICPNCKNAEKYSEYIDIFLFDNIIDKSIQIAENKTV